LAETQHNYVRITPKQIGMMRVLNGPNARLIRGEKRGEDGGTGKIVSDIRREKSKTINVPSMILRWLEDGGFISHHRRESDKGKQVFAITSRGRNYAVRDLRGPLTLTGVKLDTPVKDLVLMLLRRAGEAGTTAAKINETLTEKYELQTHYKTVGMTLYRFYKQGLARRDANNVWYAKAPRKRAKKAKSARAPMHLGSAVEVAAPEAQIG
jgi:DNA-binding MarR family transcriptional regulator